MKLITLTRGYSAKVDDDDFEVLKKMKWYCLSPKGTDRHYAYRNVLLESGKRGTVSMHRYLADVKDPKIDVDHWDRDGLNNQRYNLRVCTRTLNNANGKMPKNNTSGFKGVSFDLKRGLWKAGVDGKHIGRYNEKDEAARAYNKAAFDLWGEYARLNDVHPVFPTTEKPKMKRSNTSGYLGVSRCGRKWVAEICPNRKKHVLGRFENIEDAARAYDAAARIHYGEKAKLNFE
jgi:AP2-like factor, euAP2 lineage